MRIEFTSACILVDAIAIVPHLRNRPQARLKSQALLNDAGGLDHFLSVASPCLLDRLSVIRHLLSIVMSVACRRCSNDGTVPALALALALRRRVSSR